MVKSELEALRPEVEGSVYILKFCTPFIKCLAPALMSNTHLKILHNVHKMSGSATDAQHYLTNKR